MLTKGSILLVVYSLMFVPSVAGQACTSGSTKVGCLLAGAFAGANVESTSHQASFPSGDFSVRTLTGLGSGIATQLTTLPIPSSASGFVYEFDRSSGVYSRTEQSFGPIVSERAETVGKNKFSFMYSYQQFKLNNIDGNNLHSIGAVFVHKFDPDLPPEFLKDVVTSNANVDLNVGQFTVAGTYGLTNSVDLSIAVPIVSLKLGLTSTDTIQRIGTKGTTDEMGVPVHFLGSPSNPQSQQTFSRSQSVSGVGDVILRIKGTAKRWGHAALAFGTDVRLPTGDEYNLLGSGAVGIKPLIILSGVYGKISPHINLGYQWNGKSVLAGEIATGYRRHLPSSVAYAVGVDARATKRLTLDFDILGQEFIGLDRIRSIKYREDSYTFADIAFARDNANISNGSVGFKYNLAGTMLFYFNLAIKMNDAGLRSTVMPLFGITYTR